MRVGKVIERAKISESVSRRLGARRDYYCFEVALCHHRGELTEPQGKLCTISDCTRVRGLRMHGIILEYA